MFLSDAIKEKKIVGGFSKYLYRCNGFIQPIFCRSLEDFSKLVALWNEKSIQFCHGRFCYSLILAPGTPMSLEEICAENFVKDFNTTGSRIFKSVLIDPYVHVEYIQ